MARREMSGGRVDLLVAGDDSALRTLVASRLREGLPALSLLEAEDGTEAVQLALQRHPQIALLDVNMPRLGGIEAAAALRKLRPGLRLALYAAEPRVHLERARYLAVPLFDKLPPDEAIGWVSAQAASRLREHLTHSRPLPAALPAGVGGGRPARSG